GRRLRPEFLERLFRHGRPAARDRGHAPRPDRPDRRQPRDPQAPGPPGLRRLQRRARVLRHLRPRTARPVGQIDQRRRYPATMTTFAEPAGPLAGVRILDLSSVVMGPYATQVLGDLGADIIKVESPAGDNMRAVGPMRNAGMGHLYLHLNRNKRSIVLDLKTEAGREACLKLAESCDALLYNIRPQAMARLGLSYEAVAARNPRLVYVGAYGFSEAGPYAGRPAYDDLIQGQTGIAELSSRQSGDVPRYAPLTLADRAVGLHVAIALVSAT